MTVLRVDIERAMDDLISNEEGMRFQGLAVVLAEQHWPDLVASERKKDLGADVIRLFFMRMHSPNQLHRELYLPRRRLS